MKIRNLLYRYVWMALVMVAVYACSEQEDLSQLANRPEPNGTRTAEWKTKTVTLDAVGTLEAKLTEAMAGEELSTLEKLVVSGPMSAADFNYLRNNLSGLKSLDIKDVTITASDDWYYHNHGNSRLKNDTLCRYMFANYDVLHEIILPSNIKHIDSGAFYSCDSLMSMVIPDGVKTIREDAFSECNMMSSVILPANLEGIERHGFYSCDALKSIVIPDKVKFIGYEAFENCTNLSSLKFSSTSELDSIADWGFSNNNLKSLVLPDKVRIIGRYAFNSNDSLLSVKLPSNLEKLEALAFQSCYLLESIEIPGKVKYIGNHTFSGCRKLSSVEFSSNSELDSIANNAFNDTNLKSLVFPDKVKYIGERAFGSNDSLTNVTWPANLEYIGGYTFSGAALTTLELPASLKTLSGCSFEYCDDLTSVTIPNGVEHIGGHTFYGCHGLTELTIPESVTSIEEGFVNYCNNLRNVFWNASVNVPYNSISEYALLYVNTDTEITVDECWKNVIKNGVAQSTITIQAENNQEFAILKEFTAPEVVYKRHFGEETVPGGSSGWQTIVLPFTPDSIYHESKGRVAPFNSDIENTKPFWLRELTSDGFVDVTTITPDKPYIIAMPNSSDYLDEYCLNGEITFTAKNVTLAKTPETLEPSVGPNFELHPTYDFVKKALYIYALSSKWDDYDGRWYHKNFFIRSASDIYPFNAYVTTLGGGRSSKSEFDLDTRSSASRVPYKPNKTGIPQIGDM